MTPFFKTTAVLATLAVCLVPAARAVDAHATVTQAGTNFTYLVFNDEAAGSALLVNAFHLTTGGPFTVVSSPDGWTNRTDNTTYIDWFATNSSPPFNNNIPPGASLSGFVIAGQDPSSEPLGYALVSWDASTNICGPPIQGAIDAPSVTNLAPALNIVSESDAGFQISVQEFPSFTYVVESTTNFTDWIPLATNSAPFNFTDPGVGQVPARFFQSYFVPDSASQANLAD